jgi:hypothetical protein
LVTVHFMHPMYWWYLSWSKKKKKAE